MMEGCAVPNVISWLLRWRAAVLTALLAAIIPCALAQTRPAIERFFQNPAFASARLSPTGRYVALAVGGAGVRTKLVVVTVRDRSAKVVGSFSDADIGQFEWVNDDRLVFSLADWQKGAGDQFFAPGLFAVARDGGDFQTLVERARHQPRHLSGPDWRYRLHSLPAARDGNGVFVTFAREDRSLRLAQLDTVTRKLLPVEGPTDAIHWVLDDEGLPRVAVSRDAGRLKVRYHDPTSGEWRTIGESELVGQGGFWPLAIDGGMLFVAKRSGAGAAALYRLDLKTGATEPTPLLSLKDYDFTGELVRSGKRVVGARYVTDGAGTVWFDDAMAQMQRKIDALLPQTVNLLSVPVRPETGTVLVRSFSDVDPGRFLLYESETGRLIELGAVMPGVRPEQMAPVDMVRYPARDGLSIPAYVTLPRGSSGRKLPLVVLVHGGPNVRGMAWGWHPEAQFLASRGYAVLQPEYRGSLGFGWRHFRAGWKQWGKAMQDDLADAARWALAQGIADPDRICIAGGSYGGYAAMMGLANDGNLYRCGVSWAGVSDIELLYDGIWSDITEAGRLYSLPLLIGDPKQDAEQLRATSPVHLAARIKAPLLLAYGGADRRVPLVHGTRMRDALEQQKREVEWIVYTEEGHGWSLVSNRVDFWSRVEKFLDRHIGH
jgi:dipeptidyl aminopeptidase/acylaminoacyl peptidase